MDTASLRPRLPLDVFTRFVRSQAAGSVLLLAGTVAGLALANSRWSAIYLGLLDKEVGVSWGASVFALSLKLWINDLLMAVFFFIVGLEIKRELVAGHLSSVRKAALPVAAALGGMVVPALIYTRFNGSGPTAAGWGIPMATDIAFALGVLAVFGKRVPIGLKVFLTALAIADDLGAVLVIAIFYTSAFHWSGLVTAAVFLAAIAQANRSGIRHPLVYVVLAIGVWAGVLASGIHATVAGVLVAMLVPVRSKLDPREFLALTDDRLARLRKARVTPDSIIEDRWQLDAISDLRRVASEMRPPGLALEETFHRFVAFAILPLFAFFNAGVAIDPKRFLEGVAHPVGLGVIVGLVLGKQVGITAFSWLVVKLGWAERPEGVTWPHLYGGAVLGGIGFTMSIFVTELAFDDPQYLALAKVGVLVASVGAALWGAVVLAAVLPHHDRRSSGALSPGP
ncbi:MAG: Na+/H+ antiporter NhaA [Bacteroidales bacterium]